MKSISNRTPGDEKTEIIMLLLRDIALLFYLVISRTQRSSYSFIQTYLQSNQ